MLVKGLLLLSDRNLFVPLGWLSFRGTERSGLPSASSCWGPAGGSMRSLRSLEFRDGLDVTEVACDVVAPDGRRSLSTPSSSEPPSPRLLSCL